jgi:hypothetical protein
MRDPARRKTSQRIANHRWRKKLVQQDAKVVGVIVDLATMQRADAVAVALNLSERNRRQLFANSMMILAGLVDLGFPLQAFLVAAQAESQ